MTAEPSEVDAAWSNWPQPRRLARPPMRVLRSAPSRVKIDARLNRLEWYLREHGRPPTWDEIVALRELDK